MHIMADRKTVRLEKQHLDAIEDMDGSDVADNESEAHRMLLKAGMHEYGFRNGDYTDTTLRGITQEVARIVLYVGIGFVGLSTTIPRYEVGFVGLALVVSGLGLAAVDRLLAEYEPTVSKRLKGLVGGGTA